MEYYVLQVVNKKFKFFIFNADTKKDAVKQVKKDLNHTGEQWLKMMSEKEWRSLRKLASGV